jgi:hypothetical protein
MHAHYCKNVATRTLLLSSRRIINVSPIFTSALGSTSRYISSYIKKKKNIIMTISYATLKEENATTSNSIISHYAENESFARLAKYEGDMTVARDTEDANKLQKGIAFAQQKGVLDPKYKPEPYTELDVLGKTPDQVADQIIAQVESNSKKGSAKGSVIVLCGLSGTGKVRLCLVC